MGCRGPTSDEPGSGAEPQRNGAHVRAREEAAWGVGAPLATSRGLGQSPSATARTCAPARKRRGVSGPTSDEPGSGAEPQLNKKLEQYQIRQDGDG